MRQTLILAKDTREANAYARLVGLRRNAYRAVQKAGSIRGVRNVEVHILPAFLRRPDRHTILAALKNARTLDVYYVDPADLTESDDQEPTTRSAGPTDRELEVAYRYNALRVVEPEPPKPARTPKPRPTKPKPAVDNFFG